jgi:hypothetical protein
MFSGKGVHILGPNARVDSSVACSQRHTAAAACIIGTAWMKRKGLAESRRQIDVGIKECTKKSKETILMDRVEQCGSQYIQG